MTPYRQGYSDYEHGLELDENPFEGDADFYLQWDAGWYDAEFDYSPEDDEN